jgi:hypothetical protein
VFRLKWRKPSALWMCSTVVWLAVMIWLTVAQHRLGACLAHGIPGEKARAIAQRYAREPLDDAKGEQGTKDDVRTIWFAVPSQDGGTVRYEGNASAACFQGYRRSDLPELRASDAITEEQARTTAERESERVFGRRLERWSWDCHRRADGTWELLGQAPRRRGRPAFECVCGVVRPDGRVDWLSFFGLPSAGSAVERSVVVLLVTMPFFVATVLYEFLRDRSRRKAQASAPAGSQP